MCVRACVCARARVCARIYITDTIVDWHKYIKGAVTEVSLQISIIMHNV